MDRETRYQIMVERYSTDNVPWDDELPPPEVIETVAGLPPGRVLDLGCGYGRTAIYLAGHGWSVDGVDFVAQAIDVARERAESAGFPDIRFEVGDITDLSYLPTHAFDFVVDIGCAHMIDQESWEAHAAELVRLIRPGGRYLLFGRLKGSGEKGLDEPAFFDRLDGQFNWIKQERGRTDMPDESWESMWLWGIKR